MTSQLEAGLQEFDGKAVSVLSELRGACGATPDYLDDVIALSADDRPLIARGATWMLKAELEEGAELSPEQTGHLVKMLGSIIEWQAVLHLCQSIEGLKLNEAQAVTFASWAAGYADHQRPFLRAWSLHARTVLGRRFEALWPEADLALTRAETDPAASVRARVRQLRG